MAGHGITDLKPAPRRYRVKGTVGFETAEGASKEDCKRVRLLRRKAGADPEQAEALFALARKLDPSVTPDPQTPASRRYMRKYRARIAANLWALYDGR